MTEQTLPRATELLGAGEWSGAVADTVVLDLDARHRRRIVMRGTAGLEFLLDLRQTHRMKHGDALVVEDGRLVAVVAAPEPLAAIHCAARGQLVRIAWHIGNRHLPVMIEVDRLMIRQDHVIEDMVRGLGGTVTHLEAPFEPEGGAYAGGWHGHDHPHD